MFNKPAQSLKKSGHEISTSSEEVIPQSTLKSFFSIQRKDLLSGNRYVYYLIGFLGMLSIVWMYFLIWPIQQSYQVTDSPKITYNAPTAPPTAIPSPTPPPKQWALTRNQNGKTEHITYLCRDNSCTEFVFWNDMMFYLPAYYGNEVNDSLAVQAIDFSTGEQKTIFDASSIVEEDPRSAPRYADNLYVFDNTLFITTGGYFAGGGVYFVNLPDTQKPQKIYDGSNPRIQLWKDKYWIMGGEGDACWHNSSYSQVDLTTKKVGPAIDINSGCYDGEDLIDLDERDRMIVAGYVRGEAFDENQVYTYIMAVPTEAPEQKVGILAKEDMPAGIERITYNQNVDQLYLYGKELYTYDLSSNQLRKVDELPEYIPHYPTHTSQTYEDLSKILEEKQLPNGYQFVLK